MGDSGAMLLGLLLATLDDQPDRTDRPFAAGRRPGRADADGAAAGAAARDPGAALPGPELAFIRRTYAGRLVVPAGQAAPAPPAAGARPQPAPRRAADVRLVGAGLVRRHRARAGPDRSAVAGRRGGRCCRGRAAAGHPGPTGPGQGRSAPRSAESQLA